MPYMTEVDIHHGNPFTHSNTLLDSSSPHSWLKIIHIHIKAWKLILSAASDT